MTMDFMTAVRTCLTQKYATFQGRASRSEYWWFFLAFVIGGLITSLIWLPLYMIYALALLCPGLAVGWRRLQDTGRPGWYIAIPFGLSLVNTVLAPTMPSEQAMMAGEMPNMGSVAVSAVLGIVSLVVFILYLWWLTRPSQPETNAYGPPPVPQS
ncbi:putative membrane protein [Sulfitobacter noctilucicola]|uniref:Uncharacterized membrane protein YhaH (DUF805 family) n=1 Tax=Sulfitobacter noctilucicola TaxID=1342301 RepID=A0A7W6M9E8_9RHOB|nr:DUF805 domain-containing protein [Sulfitobacter noctilucicola]KIN63666.1 putative membrane protein [Sulfitobacter noctilucicola]MBB4174824.1 uncharacterized membrane protein YhaH (DUF805 family) [Sulfitobacter noctilucicola]